LIHPKDVLMGGFDLFALKAHQKCLTLQFTIPDSLPLLVIDPVPFVRVFHLLVDRALEVTPTGGVIVHAGRTAGGVVIVVEDEGPWVAPRDVAKLFLETSPDADLCLAARLTRRLDGLLTGTSGGRQKGLRVTLVVPMIAALFAAVT
jgi:two-component system sensor histidine kinase ChiS